MFDLSRLEWLVRQVPPAEIAARLRLAALRELSRSWTPALPGPLERRPVFTALRRRDNLCEAFAAAGLIPAVLREAEAVLAGSFTLFGGFQLSSGPGAPDWAAALPQGTPWPRDYSFDIDISGRDGRDVRFTWELSRHADLVALARAWYLSGDARCADRLRALLADWIDRNPFLRGPNWASPLEVAMRAIAWAFIDDASGIASLDPEFAPGFTAALFSHGAYLARFLSVGLNPSNHIIGEAAGLFLLGTKFRSTPPGRAWRARALRILESEIRRQTFPSGASREQSVSYHRFVTGLFALCLSVGSSGAFSESYRNRLRLMYGFLKRVSRPDGSFPDLGDSDNAAALRLSAPGPGNLNADLAFAAALFQDPRFWSDSISQEALWLLGPHAATPDSAAGGGACRSSILVPDAGLAVLRSSDGKLQVEFDCGPQGYSPVSSHGHADALSVTVWRGGNRLVDAGTYRYNAADSWRRAFRSTAFHNTVCIDGFSQALPVAAFRWITLADAAPGGSFFSDDFDWVSGKLPPARLRPWSHTRDVLRLGANIVILIDDVQCRGRHTANAYFHCGQAAIGLDGRLARVSYPDRASMSVFAGCDCARLSVLEHSQTDPSWQSPSYGTIEPSETLLASAQFTDKVFLPWVISFDRDAVKAIRATVGAAFAVEIASGDSSYLFAAAPGVDVVHVGDVRFVGRWVVVETQAGRFVRAWASRPWALEYAGKRLFTKVGGEDFAVILP